MQVINVSILMTNNFICISYLFYVFQKRGYFSGKKEWKFY